jgi:drug/metabolite transporter (DMT)-like permease
MQLIGHYFLLTTAVLLVTYSNVAIKSRVGALDRGSDPGFLDLIRNLAADSLAWSAVAATAVAMLAYLYAIRKIDLSVAQPALALVFVAVPLAAALFLGENLSALRLTGLFVIALGVLIVFLSA